MKKKAEKICIMNQRSLSLCKKCFNKNLKITAMKTSIIIKVLFVLPGILFIDYVLMSVLGCLTCLLGLGSDFYCGPYCLLGKVILIASAVLYLIILIPDIFALFRKKDLERK